MQEGKLFPCCHNSEIWFFPDIIGLSSALKSYLEASEAACDKPASGQKFCEVAHPRNHLSL